MSLDDYAKTIRPENLLKQKNLAAARVPKLQVNCKRTAILDTIRQEFRRFKLSGEKIALSNRASAEMAQFNAANNAKTVASTGSGLIIM
jgi:hypothetical protein